MNKTTLVNERGKEIMRLLALHEALSFGALRSLIQPSVTEKKLETAIHALAKKQLIQRRPFNLYGATAMFYEIAEPFRSDLGIGKVHATKLMHNDFCALSIETLRKEFPNAKLVTERYIPKDPVLTNVMKYRQGAVDSLPDVLMIIPSGSGKRPTYIALEIERFSKCTKRLLFKLGRYGARSTIDGVVYLAPDQSILRTVADRYQLMVVSKAARIRHYKDHFLLTCLHPTKRVLELKESKNSAGAPVSVIEWIHKLSSTQMSERSDRAFLSQGDVPQGLRPTA